MSLEWWRYRRLVPGRELLIWERGSSVLVLKGEVGYRAFCHDSYGLEQERW